MGKLYLRFICAIMLLSGYAASAQQTSVAIWRSQLQTCGLELQKLYTSCSHFPKLESFSSDTEFETAVKQWQLRYPLEEKTFWGLEEVKRGNPSAYYLGLNDGTEKKQFGNSIWEWVQASRVSEVRMQQLAPHFPTPKLTEDAAADEKQYTLELEYWTKLYPLEYEHLFNAKELTALNPYYTTYYKPVVMPAFISAPFKEIKPSREKYSRSTRGELNYQLALRAWLFVFEPQKFDKQFGSDYELPKSFDAEKFRAAVIKKFEDTKNPSKELLESHPGK